MSREKRQEARLTQVLDAAVQCFIEDGFHNTSMNKLAQKAGMSVGHIYHYFENKDAVIKALIEREFEDANQRTTEVVTLDGEHFIQATLERLMEAVVNKTDPFHPIIHLEILAEARRNPEIAALMRNFDQGLKRRFTEFFRNRLKLDNPESRVEMLFLIFQGLPIRIFRSPDLNPDTIFPMIEKTLRFVLGMNETEPQT